MTQLPVGQNTIALKLAWDLHRAQVHRALEEGFFCGWDLHPGQLISRYAAVYSFFDAHVTEARARLEAFREAGTRALVSGIQFDDAATAGLATVDHDPVMAVVWPCAMTVEDYAGTGRCVQVPVVDCPRCRTRLRPDGSYQRLIRHEGRRHQLWVRRGRCTRCRTSQALFP